MATTRSRQKRKALGRGPTGPTMCTILIPSMVGARIPTPCGAKCFKAGRCKEHFTDWRNAKEARGIEARQRRAKGQPIPSEDRSPRVKVYVRKGDRVTTPRKVSAAA